MKKLLLFAFFMFLLSQNGFAISKLLQNDEYHATAEKMPTPVGGLAAIYKNVTYPDMAKQAGIQGTVYVMAMVNENGDVDEVKVLKSIGGGCGNAAADALKKAKFTPGEIKGQKVKVKVAMPVVFKLK